MNKIDLHRIKHNNQRFIECCPMHTEQNVPADLLKEGIAKCNKYGKFVVCYGNKNYCEADEPKF